MTFYVLKVSNLIGDENSEQHSPNTLGIRVLPSTYELRKIYSFAHVECCGGELCSSLGVRTTVQEYPVVTCIKPWPPWELQGFRNETLDSAVKVEDDVSLRKNGDCIGLRYKDSKPTDNIAMGKCSYLKFLSAPWLWRVHSGGRNRATPTKNSTFLNVHYMYFIWLVGGCLELGEPWEKENPALKKICW